MTTEPKQPIRILARSSGAVGASRRPPGHPDVAARGQCVRTYVVGPVVVLEGVGRLSDVVDDLDLAARIALADRARGVVYDLSRVVEVDAPGALCGLAASGRHPRDWPGVPLAVAGLAPRASETLSRKALGGHLIVTTSLRQALSSVLQASLPAAESRLLAPHPTAPRASRDFVSRALLDRRLSPLIPAACTVVSELVTNAMIHAGSDIELIVSEHRRAVRLAVRDRSPDLPVERQHSLDTHGRGLMIVAGLSHAWGVMPHADGGKVVWAVLGAASRPDRAKPGRGEL